MEKSTNLYNFFYLFLLLVGIYLVFMLFSGWSKNDNEGLDAVTVENAYTDTICVHDSLPLVKLHPRDSPKTFRCLSVDGTNCITRDSLSVPADYSCNNTKKNVNTYLSVDGMRNIKVNPNLPISKVFNDFENLRTLPSNDPKINKNIKYLTCTPDGLRDPNHWCGKLWNQVQSECSGPRGQYGDYRNICMGAPEYMTQPASGNAVDTTSFSDIATAQKAAQTQSNNARAAVIKGR